VCLAVELMGAPGVQCSATMPGFAERFKLNRPRLHSRWGSQRVRLFHVYAKCEGIEDKRGSYRVCFEEEVLVREGARLTGALPTFGEGPPEWSEGAFSAGCSALASLPSTSHFTNNFIFSHFIIVCEYHLRTSIKPRFIWSILTVEAGSCLLRI
jgi:hypothetical protein